MISKNSLALIKQSGKINEIILLEKDKLNNATPSSK
jgi:hypothetical protein